ncbi:hypothetical protein [Actinomyces procaprae]|uniref:hypothetical protein n=1 Tax=Actinomyces procaprae TaxID=2560010 RepID=UPI00109D9181|nr:hypothetical protein [Actinomyces procaprae]
MRMLELAAQIMREFHQRGNDHITQLGNRLTVAAPTPNLLTASTPSEGPPESTCGQPIPLGKRAAALVLNHQLWIKRRVESIQFLPEGQTRHHISFDLFIPESLTISATEIGASGDSNMVVIPLTYMRKGALVGLDVRDATGAALPTVGADENGRITIAALQWLTKHLPKIPGTADPDLLVDDLKKVVYSKAEHTDSEPDTPSTLNACREQYFGDELSFLANRHSHSATDTKNLQLTQLHTYIDAQIRAEHVVQHQPAKPDADQAPSNRDILTSLLLLLSTVSSNYTFAVLLPRNAVKSRTVVKVSFDIALPRELQNGRHTSAPNLSQYPIYIPTRAASSTHIDLLPAEGTEILGLEAQTIGPNPDASLSIMAVERHLHLHMDSTDPSPLTKLMLDMWCERQPLIHVCIGGILAFLTCALTLWVTVFRPEPLPELLTTGNTLTILTLAFALWLSTLLKIGGHRLSQSVNEPLSRKITLLVLTVSIDLLLFPVFVGRDGEFERPGPPNLTELNTWPTFLPILISAMCTMACLRITLQACCWIRKRESCKKTMETRIGGSVLAPAEPSSFPSRQDSGDAAEVAAFECVPKLPELEAKKALDCVRNVFVHIWPSDHGPQLQDNHG